MKAKPSDPPAIPAAAAAPVPADPQVGGRFERLPDGSLRPLDESPATLPTE
jgi:hypothetical protein